jgi:hypothetical protein
MTETTECLYALGSIVVIILFIVIMGRFNLWRNEDIDE